MMEPSSLEQALKYCLENPDNLSTRQLLDKFPEHREELEPLLAFDTRLKDALTGSIPAESKAAMKQRLVNVAVARQMEAQGKERPADVPVSQPQGASRAPWWRSRLTAAAAAALVIALVWWLSATSLPDSIFYPAKLTTENALLNLAPGPTGLMEGHINLANVRLGDIATMRTLDRLAQAVPAFDNYDYHVGACLGLWQDRSPDGDYTDLARLLYASSVAGDRLFESLGSAADNLPESLRSNLRQTTDTIKRLNTSTSQVLEDAGVDLDEVLQGTQGNIADLLASLPANPTSTAAPAPTPALLTTAVPEPTLTAVLWAAQTAISEGGTAETPIVAAAETVIAGGTGTPLAQAIQTVLAHPTLTSTFAPGLPSVTVPPVTVTMTLTVQPQPSLTAVPSVATPPLPAIEPTLPTLPTATLVLPIQPTVPLDVPNISLPATEPAAPEGELLPAVTVPVPGLPKP
jgi:hypothetical protein